MEDGVTHAATKPNLLGPKHTVTETEHLTEHYSIEQHVDHHFPPTFIYHFKDDDDCPVENTLRLDRALTAAEVPHETAIYEHGAHGSGLGEGSVLTEDGLLLDGHPSTRRCLNFLSKMGILNK